MKKQTITLEQSKNTTRVKVQGVVGRANSEKDKFEQQHSYGVVQLQGTTTPVIGETLPKKQVDALCVQPNTTVNIKPKK